MLIDIIPLITIIIAILACVYASYSDLRWGVIRNKLTIPLIVVGLVLNSVYYFFLGNLLFILGTFIITGVIFGLCYLFWRLGAWAGGDVKLFTALAALIPYYPLFLKYKLFNIEFPITATYPFPFTLIINSILAILPFLLIYISYIIINRKPHLVSVLLSPLKDYRKNIILALVLSSSVTLTYYLTPYLPFKNIILSVIILYILSFVISKLPNPVKLGLISLVTVFALIQNVRVTIIGILLIFISLNIVNLVKIILTRVSREALQDDIPINELSEGMIPAYNLYERDDNYYIDDKGFTNKFKETVKTGDFTKLNIEGKLIIHNRASGLTNDDIKILKELSNIGKIPETFNIKKGVPFAPNILIGLILSLFIGDLAQIFFEVLNNLLY